MGELAAVQVRRHMRVRAMQCHSITLVRCTAKRRTSDMRVVPHLLRLQIR